MTKLKEISVDKKTILAQKILFFLFKNEYQLTKI